MSLNKMFFYVLLKIIIRTLDCFNDCGDGQQMTGWSQTKVIKCI